MNDHQPRSHPFHRRGRQEEAFFTSVRNGEKMLLDKLERSPKDVSPSDVQYMAVFATSNLPPFPR